MTRVLFVAHTGQASGAESVLLSLARLALERGDEVVVACPDGPLVQRLPDGAEHLTLPFLGLGTGPRLAAAAGLLGRSAVAARALRRATLSGTRVVVNSLLALPAVRLAAPSDGATWLVHDAVHRRDQAQVVRLGAPTLRRVVAVSEATAATVRPFGRPVLVRPNGVAWPVDAAVAEPGRGPVVGQLALLTPWKGHTVLLEAVARLPGVRLELAGGQFPGDAAHVAGLRARAAAPDLAGRVAFLGHVDPLTTMRGWDVAVSASTAPESCPLSVLEAMSIGLPVVGTDLGGTTELLRGGAGSLVDPGDAASLAEALARLLADPQARRAAGEVGRRTVAARHDVRRTLPAMLDAVLAP